MKQRFSICRDTGGEKVIIKEYAELDKGAYSLLCEESYDVEAVEAALEKGPGHVMTLLRTESFFPPGYFADKLIATLDDYLRQGGAEAVKIDADDAECITTNLVGEESKTENDSIDDLLAADGAEIIEADEPVEKLDAPIKIAEDDAVEISNSL